MACIWRLVLFALCVASFASCTSGGGGGETRKSVSGNSASESWDYEKYPERINGFVVSQTKLRREMDMLAALSMGIAARAEKGVRQATKDFGYLQEQIQSPSKGGQQGGMR